MFNPLSLLPGGVLTKVLIGVCLTLFLSTAAAAWYAMDQAEAAAVWEQSSRNLQKINQAWSDRLDDLEEQHKRVQHLAMSRENSLRQISDQNRRLNLQIEELKHEKPEVRSYLEQPIPDGLLVGLREYAASGSSADSEEGIPSTSLDVGLSGSGDSRQPN